jgi:hypothetical protein
MKIQGRVVMAWAGKAVAAAALLGHPGCADVVQLAPPGATMVLIANPPFVAANGGVSVISAIVTEAVGTPVPDGTVVQFFTTLGTIDREGKTNDGVARVNFIADARSGTANVTAVSGGITGASAVSIGGAVARRVIAIADPSRITISRSTHIIATVFDEFSNPVPNVGVIFEVSGTTEFMDSQGHPIFTDNNGRAEDVLRTRRATSGSATVTVTVLAAGFPSDTVTVPIVFE